MIIVVGHTKGGVGKSTIAVQLASYLKAIKKIDKIWAIDTDPQKSLSNSLIERNSSGSVPVISCATYVNSKELGQQVKENQSMWEHIIIDVGGRDTKAFRTALLLADVLLIPIMPRSYELGALNDLVPILDEAQELGSHVKAKAFLDCADSQGSANQEALEYLQQFKNIEILNAPVNRRKAIGISSCNGLSVFEDQPKDVKACNEIERLVNAVIGE